MDVLEEESVDNETGIILRAESIIWLIQVSFLCIIYPSFHHPLRFNIPSVHTVCLRSSAISVLLLALAAPVEGFGEELSGSSKSEEQATDR